ncbi:hypothetical protein PYCCODRAFT_1435715 [Trametes coccinea BRFM310]|uniref:Uncharacterized protein n=1 Tax=Trametes coccinea (strain BRFM310) TaxID=1353009 RepID=A0A1Y2IPY5_TRAC3|nr:hypothetical protein PYCCODRAFT_1435715 [Trametes coccinea BRFM310]
MQLASSGVRALKGAQGHLFPSGGGANAATRAIHIPAYVPRPSSSQASSTAQRVFKQTRTILSRFVAHLTAPGVLRATGDVVAGAPRAFHSPATRMPSIHDRMSHSARTFLARPGPTPFLPRAPVVPRSVTQVGLGTARSFSSGRPVFQHLAENVPIYARTFSQADWKVRMQEERERLKMEKVKAKAQAKAAKKAIAPLRPLKPVQPAPASVANAQEEELEHYFPTSSTPDVTTHLLIPLAPTPTSRLPLPENPPSSSSRPLLPLELIASMHTSHTTHALRVSTLFARLDASHVFDDSGVHCEARGDPSGLCTVLEVRFEGWTAARVRSVLGEAGTGWCVLEEVWRDQDKADAAEMDAALDTLSTHGYQSDVPSSTPSMASLSDVNGSWDASSATIDPARSFVLPTLDFSASFPAPAWSPPPSPTAAPLRTPTPDVHLHDQWSEVEDGFSSPGSVDVEYDFGSGSDGESVGSAWDYDPSEALASSVAADRNWFGFSSHFSERMGDVGGPREQMF